jgi:hypothetical protein
VPEAEDAGADMRQARELLGRLETALGFDCDGSLVRAPTKDDGAKIVPVGLEEWDAYIYQRTHRVPAVIHSSDPAGPWDALQEARRMGHVQQVGGWSAGGGELRWPLSYKEMRNS